MVFQESQATTHGRVKSDHAQKQASSQDVLQVMQRHWKGCLRIRYGDRPDRACMSEV